MKRTVITLAALLFLAMILYAQEAAKPAIEQPVPRFEHRDAFLVMGLESTNPFEEDTMMSLWKNFFEIQTRIPEPVSSAQYGVTYFGKDYDPVKMTGCTYLVGLEVKEKIEVPEGLILHRVPEAHYAVFEHKGPVELIGITYDYIFDDWITQSGYNPALQDVFEVYGDKFKPGSKESITEIWVPLEIPVDEE